MALGGVDAILLDSFGTLVSMEAPAPRLRAALARAGFEVSEKRASDAFSAEIAYYLEHHVEGRDPEALSDLQDRCAEVLRAALGLPGLDHAGARVALLGSIAFSAFPDAAPALRDLRARGLRLVVASNWDASLPRVLQEAGLAGLLDGVVSSAMVGAAKPAPALFRGALELARCGPERALYVGDSPANDVAGAMAVGMRAVLLRRDGERPDRTAADELRGAPRAAAEIGRLDELPRVL